MGFQYNKQRGCTRKRGYKTIQEANVMGKLFEFERNETLYIYLCEFCNKWHLTKNETKYKVI